MSRIHPSPALDRPRFTSSLASPMPVSACCLKALGVLVIGFGLAAHPSTSDADQLAGSREPQSPAVSAATNPPQLLPGDTLGVRSTLLKAGTLRLARG